jgi:ABC-type transporter Mla subunit MlaD
MGLIALAGCGSKSGADKPSGSTGTTGTSKPAVSTGGVDENKPIADIKAEIEKMDQQQIKDIAMKYKKAIEAKTGDISKLAEKIKQIPLTEALGAEAGKLKTDLESITQSVASLNERLNVYVAKLKEMKVDTKELEL